MPGVLDGVKVLDLSWGIAGPVTGMLLADHGADVVKVEPPGGDPFRGSPGYATWLRGRRSIELDLKDVDDRGVLHDLAGKADVVLESWSPETAERLGADAKTLLQLNAGLIVCSLSAYGDHPAHRDRPGYDALVAARLGILDEQRGHLSGAIGHMHGEEPFLEHLEIPAGMAPGAARHWTDLHVYPLAEHGLGLHRHDRYQRGPLRTNDDKAWPAHRDVPPPIGDLADRLQMDAGRAQRRPVLPVLDL